MSGLGEVIHVAHGGLAGTDTLPKMQADSMRAFNISTRAVVTALQAKLLRERAEETLRHLLEENADASSTRYQMLSPVEADRLVELCK